MWNHVYFLSLHVLFEPCSLACFLPHSPLPPSSSLLLLPLPLPGPSSMDRPLAKRCSNLSTCVLGKLSQELHKLQTFPRTNVGAGTPGKKRSAAEGDSYANYGETFDGI